MHSTSNNNGTEGYLGKIDEALTFIRNECGREYQNPSLGVICGSGLGGLGGRVKGPVSIEYSLIPGFPVSTITGHQGRLLFGFLSGVVTVCMVGRFHQYEGYDLKEVTFPIRVLARLGIKTLLVTNAAGGVNESFRVGDVMAVEDHISFPNLSGNNALSGANLDSFGPRFTSLTRIYQKDTFELLKRAAELAGYSSEFVKRGVYCAVGGPTYETAAEIRMLRLLGASAVGMSTVPEVAVAVHSGIDRILAFSLITNKCIADNSEDIEAPTHAEVLETSTARIEQLESIVENLIELLYNNE
jgi:purine-nucleoside phosphorylase